MSKRFSIILSNPPYQIEDGGNAKSAKPLYHKFVEMAFEKSDGHVLMIVPSRWMQGGKGLNEFRENMKNDKRIKLIRHFENAKDLFPIELPGGVNYFIWDKNYNGTCDFNDTKVNLNEYDIIITDINAKPILDKVINKHSFFMNNIVSALKPYGLRAHYNKWCEQHNENAVKCYTKGKVIKWVNANWTDKNKTKDKWKVLTSRADGHARNTKNWKFWVAEPGSICVETYLVVNHFETEGKAQNFVKYAQTKFFRFMLYLRVISQDINQSKFSWVPDMQDYTKVWTDKELYKHFNLSQDEIDYIESIVK